MSMRPDAVRSHAVITGLVLAVLGMTVPAPGQAQANAQAPAQQSGPAPDATPLAEFMMAERIRVVQPITFVSEDRDRPETELVLIFLRVRSPAIFLPRARLSPSPVVGGIRAVTVNLPDRQPVLVLAFPLVTPLAADVLSFVPGEVRVERLPLREVDALRGAALKAGRGYVALPESVRALRSQEPSRTFPDLGTLRRFASEPLAKGVRQP